MILTILTFAIAVVLFIGASVVPKLVLASEGEAEKKRKLARVLALNLALLGVVGLIIGGAMALLERDMIAVFAAYAVFVPIVLGLIYHGSRSFLE